MIVWVRKLGHWADSNPGFSDQWIDDGFDVRNYPFKDSTECEVKEKIRNELE